MTKVFVESQPVGIYSYDAQSRRVKKIAYGVTTFFIYDQFSNLIAESDSAGNITRKYIYLNGQPLALIDGPLPPSVPPQTISGQVSGSCSSIFAWNPKEGVMGYALLLSPFFFLIIFRYTKNTNKSLIILLGFLGGVAVLGFLVLPHGARAQEEGEKICYYHNDHLGTPIKLTDQSRNVVWSWQYGPFGEEPLTMEPNAISQNLRFPGQYYNAETGLNYNMHRYYSTKLGIYTTPDPVGGSPKDPQSYNPFPYVANNPIMKYDKEGLDVECQYFQTTGYMNCYDTCDNREIVNEHCWSGRSSGKNNPTMQNVKDIGPIPRGYWWMPDEFSERGTGPFTISLYPQSANDVWSTLRNPWQFLIHGASSNPQKYGQESKGCIICSPGTRISIVNHGGGSLWVTF